MQIQTIIRKSFRVIGIQGQGPADQGRLWIPPLWQEANARFGEIQDIITHDEMGRPQLWGLMSDRALTFAPWDTQGLYLAGCEITSLAEPPPGWALWTVPDYQYLAVPLGQDNYGEIMTHILEEHMPQQGLTLAGAIHEHYPEPDQPEALTLYFPITKL